MNEITYLNAFSESNNNGQKPAKISQEKIKKLKSNYHSALQKLTTPQVAPAQAAPVVNNVVNTPVVNPTPVINQPALKNYQQVANDFKMTIYEKSFEELPLTGARKIRINNRLPIHIKGQSNELGKGKISNVMPTPVVSAPTMAETRPVVENNLNNNVVSMPSVQVAPVVNENVMRDSSSPSVDDYLQKEIPNQENGIIIQLTGDVQKLKEQTVERTALLEQLEAKYNDLKNKREQRIKDLEEEKLSYTATLEGLTERIRNLQDAIEKEEQSLTGYKRVA